LSTIRIQEELELLRKYFATFVFAEQGLWILIPEYKMPDGAWNPKTIEVAFQIPNGYPGTNPYGIYVREGITYNGSSPNNYQFPANLQPPFAGKWGILSWSPEGWTPTASVLTGPNLLNYVRSFSDRFKEGA
jgi:hypothetical protein